LSYRINRVNQIRVRAVAFPAHRLDPIAEIAMVRLGDGDIVRHPLVADVLTVL
jgi:hypothetical protein